MRVLHGIVLLYVLGTTQKSHLPTSSARSLLLFLIVLLVHAFLISYVLKHRFQLREVLVVEPHVNLILLAPEKFSPPSKDLLLNPIEYSISTFEIVIPNIEIKELDLDSPDFNDTYELPHKNADKYKDVFDPKLRKKLQDLPPQVKKKPKIQYLGVGITLEDIGNGMCLYGDAFHKTGYKVKCGPDQGEQMMQNVERTLADPLGLK